MFGYITKTFAIPYTNYPNHALNLLYAFNYQYPLLISWDVSLFHAPYLPNQGMDINVAKIENDYFWGINNDPLLQAYNMLLDDHANAPAFNWGSQDHFPMAILMYHTNTGIEDYSMNHSIKLYPNPTSDSFAIQSEIPVIGYLIIYKAMGRVVYKQMMTENLLHVVNPKLSAGIYFIQITDPKSRLNSSFKLIVKP